MNQAQWAVIVLLPLFAAGIFFVSMVYPIWALVHCARSTSLSQTEKTVWIIVLVLSWSFGALIYGFVTKERGPFKVTTWITAVISAAIAAAMIWALSALMASLPRMNEQSAAQISFHLQKTDQSELTDPQKSELVVMLKAFQKDSKATSIFHLKRLTDISAMQDYLRRLIEDKRLSAKEYSDLRDYYQAYRSGKLDAQTLKKWSENKKEE